MKRSFLGIACAALIVASAPAAAESLQGFGEDIPLSVAARQIVPEGYDVSFSAGVDAQREVSWRGGKDWQSVLEDMAFRESLRVSYSGSNVIITASGAAAPAQGGIVVVPYRGHTTAGKGPIPLTKGRDSVIDLSSRPDVHVTSVESWQASRDETLRTVIESWAGRSGWTLVWNSDYEYPLQAGATFHGDFTAATSDLVKSMAEARPAVTAAFYRGNKVVVIGNDSADAVN